MGNAFNLKLGKFKMFMNHYENRTFDYDGLVSIENQE